MKTKTFLMMITIGLFLLSFLVFEFTTIPVLGSLLMGLGLVFGLTAVDKRLVNDEVII